MPQQCGAAPGAPRCPSSHAADGIRERVDEGRRRGDGGEEGRGLDGAQSIVPGP